MMRTATILALLLSCCVAQAGTNPDVTIYLSFDYTGSPVHERDTSGDIYHMVNVYVCLGNLEGGTCGVTFRLSNLMEEYPGLVGGMYYYGVWEFG